MKKIKLSFIKFFLLIRNLYKGLHLYEIESEYIEGVKYCGLKKEYLKILKIEILHIFPNSKLNWKNSILYSFLGKRFVVIALNKNNDLIGFNLYYFNQRDFKENTIHEGLIGVEEKYQGKGIATKMRLIAKKNFSKSNLHGVSSRISINNTASLKAAENLGFKPVEKYYDSLKKEERYYMVCKLGEVSGD